MVTLWYIPKFSDLAENSEEGLARCEVAFPDIVGVSSRFTRNVPLAEPMMSMVLPSKVKVTLVFGCRVTVNVF